MNTSNRRTFLKSALAGGMAAAWGMPGARAALGASETSAGPGSSRVALMTGGNRMENIFNALQPFSVEIKKAVGDRPVVIKPNNVSINIPLCASHADCLAGILEFLKSIGRTDKICIAESAANGPTLEGFHNYGYFDLKKKYTVDLVDLDDQPVDTVYTLSDEDFRPHAVRMSRRLLDPESFVISAAVMKTHDLVVATLSLKNIVFGAPIKDKDSRGGRGGRSDKRINHGGGIKGVNYSLFTHAPRLGPELAVIDGFEGMEGYGPTRGTPVDHKVAVASLDWLAADRTAVELMGIDFADIGYLNYCAQAGLGQADLSKIEIIGERVQDLVKKYKLADNFQEQMIWKA
ncbi:MAG: DUF362 domain-containing protein [bacterium]